MKLLTNEQINNLKRYIYKGADTSYIYIYILSPLAQAIADLLPDWIAPNTITLVGLSFSILSCILTLIFNPNLDENGPKWLHLFVGISLFIYQTLDNVDGKQARKTNSSSPLGMLFDHGCDAINAGISAIPMSSIFGVGWTIGIFFPIFCGFVPFYIQTWEEYYLGEMNLPVINGPTEGLLVAISASIYSFFNGAAVWHLEITNESIIFIFQMLKRMLSNFCTRLNIEIPFLDNLLAEKLTYFRLLVFVAITGAVLTFVSQFLKVILSIFTKRDLISKVKNKIGFKNTKEIKSVSYVYVYLKPLIDLLPFFVFFPSSFLWCLFSEKALSDFPVLSVCTISLVFVEMVMHLMLQHITDSKCHPEKRYLVLPMLLLALNVCCLQYSSENTSSLESKNINYVLLIWNNSQKFGFVSILQNKAIIPEALLIYPYFVIALLIVSAKLYLSCTEFADALEIYVFRTDKKTKDDKNN